MPLWLKSILWAILVLASFGLIVGLQYNQLDYFTPKEALLSFKALPLIMSFFLLSAGHGIIWLGVRRTWLLPVAWWWLFLASASTLGVLCGRAWETYQVLEEGHWAITNLYEVSLLLLGVMGVLTCIFSKPKEVLGAFISPFVLAGVGFVLWLASIGQANPNHLVPALQSYWLPFHVLANFIAYGAFAVAAAAGGMHLLRARHDQLKIPSVLPTQEVLANLGARAVMLGFPVFTIAILLGAIWAYDAWGGYWSWDPKETWALIVWLVYAGYLHARMHYPPTAKLLAIWLFIGFLVTLFCYLGVNMFLSGLHSYGQLS